MVDKYIVSSEKGIGRMKLFGVIDSEGFITDKFISEFEALETDESITEIEILINSKGGSVFSGFPIYKAISESNKKVTTIIDSVGASMGAMIFLAGKKRKIFQHGQLMIHGASYSDGSPEDDAVRNTNTTIFNIIKGITKKAKGIVTDWLSKDSWFTAYQAVENGFAHEVIPTKIHASLIDEYNLQVRDIVNMNDIHNLKNKYENNEMEEIINELKLKSDANHTDIKAAIQDLRNTLAIKIAEITNREEKIVELQGKVSEFEAIEIKKVEAEIENLVETAFTERKINAQGKDTWKSILKVDFENGKKALTALNKVEKISDLVTDETVPSTEPKINLTPLQQMMESSF